MPPDEYDKEETPAQDIIISYDQPSPDREETPRTRRSDLPNVDPYYNSKPPTIRVPMVTCFTGAPDTNEFIVVTYDHVLEAGVILSTNTRGKMLEELHHVAYELHLNVIVIPSFMKFENIKEFATVLHEPAKLPDLLQKWNKEIVKLRV